MSNPRQYHSHLGTVRRAKGGRTVIPESDLETEGVRGVTTGGGGRPTYDTNRMKNWWTERPSALMGFFEKDPRGPLEHQIPYKRGGKAK